MNEQVINTSVTSYKILYAVVLILGLLISTSCNAMRGGGGGFNRGVGGGYHQGGVDRSNVDRANVDRPNDYHANGYYYGGNAVAPAVNVNVPYGAYPSYPNSCSSYQQCDSYGNCVENQVCN